MISAVYAYYWNTEAIPLGHFIRDRVTKELKTMGNKEDVTVPGDGPAQPFRTYTHRCITCPTLRS